MNILRARFRTDEEFEEAFRPDFPGGGLFCATTHAMSESQAVIVEISAPSLPNKMLLRGQVRSWRPARPRLRVRAGAVIEFDERESLKRDFILDRVRGSRRPVRKRRHSRLPIEVPIRYRCEHDTDLIATTVHEISVGGCALRAPDKLPIGQMIVIEITPPGSVSPMSIAAEVTYHGNDDDVGIRFLARDAGGSRRLSELIRRLRQS